ncbi:2-dehydropantoate 2-reductase [Hydrogenophaga sp. 2FB]|uniref:ketopantoate reductase family protein n=1 Tax=Hydrogenophaga sp. 2FB TaxID=2502187 RepID=UPI001484DA5B|nr:2-dehydropantoate 2-reductase [Hydrogenophaga sp. 2FB]
MKVCVFGAGAVGGYLASKLLASGLDCLSIVARGAHGSAIAQHGLTLVEGGVRKCAFPVQVVASAQKLQPQDLVFVALKAHALPAAAADIAHLMAPGGTAVFVTNGIPWWWTFRGASTGATPLPLLDPDGALWKQVRPERALGCVVYSANRRVGPGVIEHVANNRWIFGEPDGRASARLHAVHALAQRAGLHAETPGDVRREIWTKLLRNAPLNSVCALTRLPIGRLAEQPGLVALCHGVIDEIVAIAAAQGHDIADHAAEAREAPLRGGAMGGQATQPMLPSMLQDVLAGARTESEAILGQVQRFARDASVAVPRIDVLLSLLRGLEASVQARAG